MGKENINFVHFYCVPFTGLGLFNGYRGDQWLRNRIKIFNEFVLPSIKAQGSRDIYLWFCWRLEEKTNPIVKDFITALEGTRDILAVHTFGGIPFYDDKYDDKTARERLMRALELSLPELKGHVGDLPYVLMTIQPSDDMYLAGSNKLVQAKFRELIEQDSSLKKAVGFEKGYIMSYNTKEIAEYATTEWTTDKISTYHTDTIPPFFTILFSGEAFLDPQKHFDWIGPYKSHEYIGDHLEYTPLEKRSFVVGCHGENISTTYNHRYKGRILPPEEAEEVMIRTGTLFTEPLMITPSTRLKVRSFVNKLPFRQQLKNIYYQLPIKLRKI